MSKRDRRHREEIGNEQATQPDRDRILYTPEFRRLAAVTQVAVAEGGLLFHNRLTHSLKVAQIARRLAKRLQDNQPELADAYGSIDEDTVEAAALAHDLGHPPFGHIAEKRLDRLLTVKDADGFEGNPQSFRIVTKLAVYRGKHGGLNLSRATLHALLKYPWFRQTTDPKNRKWGAYQSEAEDFQFARELHKGNPDGLCVEAEVTRWADDITYSVHDIEDFYQAGFIPLDRLARSESEVDHFLSSVFERWDRKKIPSPYDKQDLKDAFKKLLRVVPISEAYTGSRRQQAALRDFTLGLIENYVTGTMLADPSNSKDALAIDKRIVMEVRMLKELLWHYVVKNPALATQEYGQGQVIERLFSILSNIVMSNDVDDWAVLPGWAREQMQEIRQEQGANIGDRDRLRVVVDTIAGMTEQQALQMFHRLTGVSPGSLFQRLVV
jgi:dGTPase